MEPTSDSILSTASTNMHQPIFSQVTSPGYGGRATGKDAFFFHYGLDMLFILLISLCICGGYFYNVELIARRKKLKRARVSYNIACAN